MTKTATKPQNLVVYMVLENTTSGMAAGLTDMGPLYNDVTEGTLVEVIRLTDAAYDELLGLLVGALTAHHKEGHAHPCHQNN